MEKNLTSPAEKQLKYSKIFLSLATLLLIALLAAGGTIYYLQSAREAAIEKAQAEVEVQTRSIAKLISAEKIPATLAALEALKSLMQKRVYWSKIVFDIRLLQPANVFFNSYAAKGGGKLALSAVAESYYAVADLLDTLQAKARYFKNPFVPAIARGTDQNNSERFSFSLSAEMGPVSLTQPADVQSGSGSALLPKVPVR
jgi:Tfp pilus assembly protein PilN